MAQLKKGVRSLALLFVNALLGTNTFTSIEQPHEKMLTLTSEEDYYVDVEAKLLNSGMIRRELVGDEYMEAMKLLHDYDKDVGTMIDPIVVAAKNASGYIVLWVDEYDMCRIDLISTET